MLKKVRRFLTISALVLSVIAMFSCSRRAESGYKTIPYVNSLLADSLPQLRTLAASGGKSSGSVVLAGDPVACLRLSERMMISDEFDNIDARKAPDGLPDFSGETMVSLLDFARTPYDSLTTTAAGRGSLRKYAVMNALSALRIPGGCKILIICSPALSEYGGSDVANLFERIGCDVPVVHSSAPTYSFTEACFREMRDKNIFTHNISYPAARLLMAVRDSSDSGVSVLPFVDSLVPASFPDTVGVLAPNTYYSNVIQNQR